MFDIFHTYKARVMTTMAPRILWCVIGCIAVSISTGFVLASWYQPSSEVMRDEYGRGAEILQADTDIRDADGDVIAHKDQYYVSRSSVVGRSGEHESARGQGNRVDVPSGASKSWYSVYVALSQNTEYGRLLRSMHAGAMDVTFIGLSILCALILLNPGGSGFQPSHIPLRTTLVCCAVLLFAAWSGSVLPWDIRAQHAFSIGTHVMKEYIPLFGSIGSTYLWEDVHFRIPNLMRVFILHVVVLVPLLLIMYRRLMRRSGIGRTPNRLGR